MDNLAAIVFDLDGTLLDSLGDLADSVNFALEKAGYPTHEEQAYRYFVGSGAKKLIERALPKGLEKRADYPVLFKQVYDLYDGRYRETCLDRTRPYPGILEMLVSLQKAGFRLMVLSNKPDTFVQWIVSHFFGGIFDFVAGQREGVERKPSPNGLYLLMEQLRLKRREVLFVGDSDIDVQTAKNAGVRCLGVSWGFRGREELTQAGADLLADNAAEAAETILRLGCRRCRMYFSSWEELEARTPFQDGAWDMEKLCEYLIQSCSIRFEQQLDSFFANHRSDGTLAGLMLDILISEDYDGSDAQIGAARYLRQMDEAVLQSKREKLQLAQKNGVYWKRPFQDNPPAWL